MLINFLLSALDTPLTSHSCLLTRTPWFTPVLFYNTGKAFWRVFWLVSLTSKSELWLSTPVCLLRITLLGWDISVYTESLNIRTHYHSFMGVAGATLIRGKLPHHFIWLKKMIHLPALFSVLVIGGNLRAGLRWFYLSQGLLPGLALQEPSKIPGGNPHTPTLLTDPCTCCLCACCLCRTPVGREGDLGFFLKRWQNPSPKDAEVIGHRQALQAEFGREGMPAAGSQK